MVRLVHEGSAASAAGIGCFDELLNINGERVTSAVHAVAMIRDAPTGTLYVRMRGCPVRLSRAAATLQRAWVRANRTRHGMVRASVIKPDQSARLGIAFSPAFERAAVVAAVSPEGIAASAVQVGDRILRVNGDKVGSPTAAARQLREALGGEIRLLVQLAWAVDGAALAASEAAEAEAEALAAAAEARPRAVTRRRCCRPSCARPSQWRTLSTTLRPSESRSGSSRLTAQTAGEEEEEERARRSPTGTAEAQRATAGGRSLPT